jgi:hypothetical protein
MQYLEEKYNKGSEIVATSITGHVRRYSQVVDMTMKSIGGACA